MCPPKSIAKSAARTGTEGLAVLLTNATMYQGELVQMVQSKVPQLNGQIGESLMQTARAAAAWADAAAGRPARQANGSGANGSRTSKAD